MTPSAPTPCACDSTDEKTQFKRLDEVIEQYRNKPGALIPVLQIAQSIFGYLPEKALQTISEKLGEPYSRVFGVVTFYSFFSRVPRGKHVIRVCMGTACYIRGAQQVLESFETRLNIRVGQTTGDRMFTLEVARCFGACGLAPAVSIDEKVYKNVVASRVGGIVDAYYRHQTAQEGTAS